MRARKLILSVLASTIPVATPAVHALVMELVCELGKRVSVQGNPQTDNAIDLRWEGQMHHLLMVVTSTGVNRF